MHVFALVGPSGTGKSHRAIRLAHELHCQVIIDDGLVIEDNRILAGTSAKRSPTRIGAIKTALFQEPDHRTEARQALRERSPDGVLILGTSEGMVEKICQRLELLEPKKIIYIQDIASTKEIRKARYNRTQHARHVVPAPALEVKNTLGGTLIDPIKVFFRKKGSERKTWAEQSVVRPTFTSLGNLSISSPAIIAGVTHQVLSIPGVAAVGKVAVSLEEDGLVIDVPVSVAYRHPLHTLGQEIQRRVHDVLDTSMGVSVLAVHVLIEKLVHENVGEK